MSPPGGRGRATAAAVAAVAIAGALLGGAPRVTAALDPSESFFANPEGSSEPTPTPTPAPAVVSRTPFLVSPRTAKPGEVVHIRFPGVRQLAAGYVVAWLNDPGFTAPITVRDPKAGAFADLPVPPGAPRGPYPIVVVGPGQTAALFAVKRSVITIPFIVTRSEGPPTWSR